jgi:hypothetical protein
MEEAANKCILSQRVVNCHSLASLRDVSRDPLFLEERQGGRVHMQFHVHTLREDHSSGTVRDELLDVSRLDTRLVPVPVSFQSQARPPPGKSLKSFPVLRPSTSSWPQETARIFGEVLSMIGPLMLPSQRSER